jgi:hypothetical protein
MKTKEVNVDDYVVEVDGVKTVDYSALEKVWYEFKKVILELENDVLKGSNGVKAALTRSKKGMRNVKKLATDYVRFTTSLQNKAKELKNQ